MSTQNERLLAALSAAEKHSESIGESEWFSAEALSDFGKLFISPSDARFIAECSHKVVSSLLSRIEWLEAEKHSWKTYAKGLYSRIDALSKDAERYRWLTTHYKYTNDSMAELWFDNGVENSDSKESIDRSIDAAIGAREAE